MMKDTRDIDLDALKGIAILAIVLYHIGLLPFGYLGVDVFLVINGYFITHTLLYQFNKKEFSYTRFLKKRLVRLWPLLVLASFISLIIGYFVMLPDNYENLGQSVVATNIFANNILSCITTGDYWDIVNSHKPLMHTWYVGILVQCYIVFPFIVWGITKFGKKTGRNILILLTVVFATLYILPLFYFAQKFYYLPFRLFEFLIGATIASFIPDFKIEKNGRLIYFIITILVIAFFTASIPTLSNELKVLLVSLLTGLGILFSVSTTRTKENSKSNIFYRILALLGAMSYSIFVWHQVAIAYYKSCLTLTMGWQDYLILLIIIALCSLLSYYGYEKVTEKWKSEQHINRLLIATICGAILVSGYGLFLYINAGVVKDIPELEISTNNAHRGMHSEYCDRIYSYDHDFKNNGKIKIMGFGNSFVRDWFNVLLESDYSDSIDLSYGNIGLLYAKGDEYAMRVKNADIVFLNSSPASLPEGSLKEAILNHPKVLGIGTKSFGITNCYPYARKRSDNYYQIRMPMIESVKEVYPYEKEYYGENYIDFIAPLIDEDGMMPVFTDDSLYIAPDCRHLSHGGARYYAKVLDVSNLIKELATNQ